MKNGNREVFDLDLKARLLDAQHTHNTLSKQKQTQSNILEDVSIQNIKQNIKKKTAFHQNFFFFLFRK